jgi:hypothetical protein
MRRSIHLIALSLLLPLWPAGDADAQFNGALRGEYNMTLSRNCNVPGGPIEVFIAVNGVANFAPSSGTVSFTGRSTTIGNGQANSANQTCTGTYSVSANGTLSETLNCNLSFIDGPLAPGGTATLNGIDLEGQLSLDGTVVLLRNAVPNTETFQLLTEGSGAPAPNPGTGTPQVRVCSVSGTATSRR